MTLGEWLMVGMGVWVAVSVVLVVYGILTAPWDWELWEGGERGDERAEK